MIKGREDILRSLIEVFLMEKGTREFYSKAAAKAGSREARETFSRLSKWEQDHMDYIQFLYQAFQEDRDGKTFEEFKRSMHAPDTEAGIPVKELERKLEDYTIHDESGALSMAMELEGKAYSLYNRLSQNAGDPNARIFFSDMMGQELKHIDHLKILKRNLSAGKTS